MFRRIFVDIETLPPDKGTSTISLPEEVAACSDEEFRRLALDGDFGRVPMRPQNFSFIAIK